MFIKEAAYPDTDRIYALHEMAHAAFGRGGLWQSGYDYDSIFGDIDDGICYTLVNDGGDIVASFVCDFSEDTEFRVKIGCKWHEGEYAVLHRLAVSGEAEAAVGEIVSFAVTRCKENGVQSIRCGVSPDNEALCKGLELSGFEPCGRFRSVNGGEQMAYRLWIE